MAKNVVIAVILLLAALLTAGIVIVGIFLFSGLPLSPFTPLEPGYEETLTYYYKPETPLTVEKLNIDVEATGVEIRYNTTPTDEYIKAIMHFKIYIPSVDSYTEVYHPIEWENITSPVLFTLERRSEVLSLSTESQLTMILRTDVTYEIYGRTTSGGITAIVEHGPKVNKIDLTTNSGGVELYADDVSFDNEIKLHADSGGITLDFKNCITSDNLDVSTSSGGVKFKSSNMRITQDVNWELSASSGGIEAEILQYVDIEGSVTGTFTTGSGGIDLIYKDNLATIGARISASAASGGVDFFNEGNFVENDDLFYSMDYPAIHNYDLTLSTSSGGISVYGLSA